MDTQLETIARTPPLAGNVPYQAYERDEETERLAYHYTDFRMYLKAIMWCFRRDFMRLHMVASQKID